MNNTIVLLAGKSGSGKSTVEKVLRDKYGWKTVTSYTTRPKRTPDEAGHIFISESEFDKIKDSDMVAYTLFNGYRYCATKQQVEDTDIYIVDKRGIEEFGQRYDGDKNVLVIYIDVDENILLDRMVGRGDSKEKALERMEHDRKAFADIEDLVDIIFDGGSMTPAEIAEEIFFICTGKRDI